MGTILEQQKELMDLRSKVEKAEGVTSGIDGKLQSYDAEIEDLWKAMDDLIRNPMQ
jgi:hypothetical protein